MHSLREWRAVPIEHGIGANFEAHRIDDQRIAFVRPDRIAILGRSHLGGVSRV
jgi:hypothetical protein